jgi:uncharacterized protein YkwD
MRTFTPLFITFVACGQMYQQPGGQQAPPPQPITADDWREQPVPPPGSEPRLPAVPPPGSEPPLLAARAPAPTAGAIAQRFVDAHNKVRAKHCAAPLAWSDPLAAVAQKWADTLRDRGCALGHSGGKYGENLAVGSQGLLDPEATVAMWYDEVKLYRFPDGGFSMKTGHFTQVVWRGTARVGCGHATCNDNDVWVCNYDPAGNWDGQYRDNVRAPGCPR